MWRWVGLGLGALVLLAGGFVGRTLYLAGAFRSIEPHFAGTCELVRGAVGPEDLTVHPKTGVVYVAAYDRRAADRGERAGGGIYAYDPAQPSSGLVNVTPFAPDTFRPHGLSLWVGDDGRGVLFVINHPPRESGGPAHAVEVFDLVEGKLTPRSSIVDEARLVMPNDLVAVGPDRFYLTNTHQNPPGRAQTIETYLQRPGARVLFYDGDGFQDALVDRVFPNGINTSADGRSLYLAETTLARLSIFDRDLDTGALALRREIDLGTGPDNIEVDASGQIWIGAHPKLLDVAAHRDDPATPAPAQVIRVSPTSGAVEEVYLNAGDQLSAASVATLHDGHLLIGQILDDGILDCQLGS